MNTTPEIIKDRAVKFLKKWERDERKAENFINAATLNAFARAIEGVIVPQESVKGSQEKKGN